YGCVSVSCYFAMSSFFFSSRRRHTRFSRDWSSDVCSSDLMQVAVVHLIPFIAEQLRQLGKTCELLQVRQLHTDRFPVAVGDVEKIGRASCRERVEIWVVDGA